MKAILLAAGVGRRLSEASGNKPKCLLEFDGVSLLRRHLDALQSVGIREIIIVAGYQADLLEAEIARSGAAHLTEVVLNPDYRKGSLISLLIGLRRLNDRDELLLMDADVLYDPRILARALDTAIQNCFLLDRDFVDGEEPVKICVRDGTVVEFRKRVDPGLEFDFQGESVGFFRFAPALTARLILTIESYLARHEDEAPYEEMIRDLLLESPSDFGFEEITGLPWIEIDFPEDVVRANAEILPKIGKEQWNGDQR
ncbi:MAG: phosphocholine cytidylyltransferase family protein [bacterium]